MKYGFVYIWFDRKHKRFYIGSQWGTEDDGYICSSSWMKSAYNNRKDDFKKRIIKTNILSKEETIKKENYWLHFINENELGKKYYNLKKVATGGAIRNGMKHSEETKQKMSKSHLGKVMSEESKQKISIKQIGLKKSEESNKKRSESLKGRKHSEETKMKMKDKAKLRGNNNSPCMSGKHHSEESKQKMREAKIGHIPWNKGKKHDTK